MDNLPKNKIKEFFGNCKLIKYRENELIYRPSDLFTNILYIKSGYMRIYAISHSGKEITLKILQPGNFVSFTYAFLGDMESKYYYETLSHVEVYRSGRSDFFSFIKNDPQILFYLLKEALIYGNHVATHFVLTTSGKAYLKVLQVICHLGKYFAKQNNEGLMINFKVTHRLIASMVGLTRETVSLQIGRLEKKKLISQKRLLIITDFNKLKEEISSNNGEIC